MLVITVKWAIGIAFQILPAHFHADIFREVPGEPQARHQQVIGAVVLAEIFGELCGCVMILAMPPPDERRQLDLAENLKVKP